MNLLLLFLLILKLYLLSLKIIFSDIIFLIKSIFYIYIKQFLYNCIFFCNKGSYIMLIQNANTIDMFFKITKRNNI